MRALAGPLVVLLAACSAPSPDVATLEAVRSLAERVERDRVASDMGALVAEHSADVRFDCDALELEHIDQVRRPVCALTRDRARAFVRSRFEALGLDVSSFVTERDGYFTESIVGDVTGTDRPEEIVLVTAHFDAFYAGADDNTSGAVAMLEIARVLSATPLSRTVRFVGWDLEEFGLVGSTRYVRDGALGAERVVATINFDCIGYTDDAPGSQQSLPGLPVPERGDFIAIIANDDTADQAAVLRGIGADLGVVPTQTVIAGGSGAAEMTGNLMRSDHAPFWLEGLPALFLTDTANFRNPNYHRETDTTDTIDFDFLANVTRLSAVAAAYWAEVPE